MNSPEQPDAASLGRKVARAFSRPLYLSLLLAVVTLAVYWRALSCDFIDYDDPAYFRDNTHVLAGLSAASIRWAFTTGYMANWHPLTWLSLMLDAELFGKGPLGPHLTNLLFHLANTTLLFLLLRRLSGATWRSALVAALFALHPLHVESVAWISERKDVLSAFFGFLSLWCYTGYVANDRRPVRETNKTTPASDLSRVLCRPSLLYALALFFFALGLMSKPMLVTLPFVMLLLDFWPLQRLKGATVQRRVIEKLPFFLFSAIASVATFMVQQKGGAVVALAKYSFSTRVSNAFVSYARYLGKTFWPADLAVPYPYVAHWPWGWVLSAVVLWVGLSMAGVGLGRKFPFLPIGLFWFVGTLIPVIGLVQVGNQAMADRYTYLPLVGIFIILSWGGAEALTQWRCSPRGMALLAVALLLAAGWRARIQTGFWQNDRSFFLHTLAVTDNNDAAWVNIGNYLSARGDIPGAMECYSRAHQINPLDASVLYDLGNGYNQLGRWDEAIACYRQALKITPNQTDVLNNLGLALTVKKQFADAISCFEAALKWDPGCASAHNNLGTVLFIQQQFAEAVRHFREAVRLTPDDPQVRVNLGDALVKQGQTAEAVRCYQEALRLKPGDPQITAKLRALGTAF